MINDVFWRVNVFSAHWSNSLTLVIISYVICDQYIITCINVKLLFPGKCVPILFIYDDKEQPDLLWPLSSQEKWTRGMWSTYGPAYSVLWREKKDLATPSRLLMSCDQSVNASKSTYSSIITALAMISKTLTDWTMYFDEFLT